MIHRRDDGSAATAQAVRLTVANAVKQCAEYMNGRGGNLR